MIDLSLLWVAEWIVCAFFAYLLVLSQIFPLGGRSRLRVFATGTVCVGGVVMLSQLRPSLALQVARACLPVVYLLQGYWICGLFMRQPVRRTEARLLDADRLLFRRTNLTALLARGPRLVLGYFELTYLLVHPMVPGSLGLFFVVDGYARIDSFWTSVLLAGYGCYGLLPWIQTRPPRAIEHESYPAQERLLLRRLNLFVLRHGSVQINTLPSGHTSVAFAGALAVASVHTGLGVALLILATSITVATVLGRYRYSVDAVAGVLVGIVSWWISFHGLAPL